MIKGVSTYESYDGPQIEATEFCLHDGNLTGARRKKIVNSLRQRFKSLSAHLPSFLPYERVVQEVAFDDNQIDYFVAHITKRSKPGDWLSAWREYASCGKKIYFENHNQEWHETDAGMVHAEQFKPLVDAGHKLCLDTGHILYDSLFRPSKYNQRSIQHLQDTAESEFEKFLELPIGAVHAHTVDLDHNCGQPMDHQLSGYDIGPWLKRIVAKNPDVVILVEVMDSSYTNAMKIAALERWLS